MPRKALTRAEAETRAELLDVHAYEVELDLLGEGGTFRSTTTVRFSAASGASTFIEATSRELHSLVLNGRELDAEAVSDGFRIRLDGLEAENELRVDASFGYTNTGEGLHRFVDPVDGERYVYTELAVAEANRVFAVFDQPDLKSTFRFTIAAPAHWSVISNSATPEPEPRGDGGAVWRFAPSPVIASYVAAVVGGPFAAWRGTARTAEGREVPLGVFARASLAEHVEPEVMFETVDRGIRFFEDRFGVPFPYPKYDQIFVPEYNWGAMENVGAVTFNEGYLFRSRVPAFRKERRANVILHELSHMWFGNLVTMKWWNDLWLNESFATWAASFATAELTEFTGAWATFAAEKKSGAAEQDQLPTTHPIVAEIADTADTEVNFDRITYDKGASVLKQLVAWVGLDAFLAGVGAYLRAHADGNATLGDLLAELERSSGRELGAWSALWLETAGIDTLGAVVETDDADGAAPTIRRLAIEQRAEPAWPTLRPHRIAVGFYRLDDGRLHRTERFELDVDGAVTEVPDAGGLPCPDLVLVNDDDLDYAKIRLDARSQETVSRHLATLDDPVARAIVWGSAWDSVRSAELAPSDFVRLVIANIGQETESVQRALTLSWLETALDRYFCDERASVLAETGDALWALVGMAEPGGDAQLQFVKSFTRVASSIGHAAILQSLLDGQARLEGLEIDTDLRWELVTGLAALGEADEAAIELVLDQDDTAKGRQLAATARAARPEQAVKDAAWERVATDETLSNDLARAIVAGWQRTSDPALLATHIEPYFSMLQSVWANRGFTMAKIIVRGLFPAPFVDAALVEATRDWLEANDGPAPLRRLVLEEYSELVRAVRARARDAQASPEPAR